MANPALQQLFTLFQAGRHAEMADRARALLATSPEDGGLWKALSVAQQMLGQDATAALQAAMQRLPQDAELPANLGALHAAHGRWPQAQAAYEAALRLNPRLAGAHNNLGNALLAQQQPQAALAAFDAALALQPTLAAAVGNRGRALLALQRFDEAAAAFTQAGLHALAGTAFTAAGRGAEAVAALRRVPASFALGELLQGRGEAAAAADVFEKLLAREPGHAEAACNLALLRPAHGEAALRAVLAAGVSGERCEAVMSNLTHLLLRDGRHAEAVAICREADDGSPRVLGLLSQALKQQGALDAADAALSRLIAADPAALAARSDRLLLRACRGQPLRAEALDFARQLRPAPAPGPAPRGGPLRLGLVSADLRLHPVGRLARAWLPALAARCEVTVYASHREDDALTAQLKRHPARWRAVAGLSDPELAAQIEADGITALVDLNGHTGGHRLGVFARRPAPWQASWLGFAGSTGLAEIDAFIGDRWLLPDGAEADFVEGLIRLPHSFTACAPPPEAPGFQPRSGPITFGSFNALHKLNDALLARWAAVLAAVPGSRLLLKAPGLQQPAEQAALRARWPGEPERLTLEGPAPLAGYLNAFNRVDIALDPSPHSGGMTTLDGLWMGVPMLTLPGPSPISRQGLSFLHSLGVAEGWVAADEADYLRLAVARAADCRTLQPTLRQRMAASPLCDGEGLAEALIGAIRAAPS